MTSMIMATRILLRHLHMATESLPDKILQEEVEEGKEILRQNSMKTLYRKMISTKDWEALFQRSKRTLM